MLNTTSFALVSLTKILAFQYRLSHTSPFPAPLIDAIAAYVYLVDNLKIPSDRIIVTGDSAGAHLANSFVPLR